MQHKGPLVSYADPPVPSPDVEGTVLKAVEVTDQRLAAADCVVILTDHADFDYRQIVDVSRLVVDTRNATRGPQPPADPAVTLSVGRRSGGSAAPLGRAPTSRKAARPSPSG